MGVGSPIYRTRFRPVVDTSDKRKPSDRKRPRGLKRDRSGHGTSPWEGCDTVKLVLHGIRRRQFSAGNPTNTKFSMGNPRVSARSSLEEQNQSRPGMGICPREMVDARKRPPVLRKCGLGNPQAFGPVVKEIFLKCLLATKTQAPSHSRLRLKWPAEA